MTNEKFTHNSSNHELNNRFMNDFQQTGFAIEVTTDGSPTLRFISSSSVGSDSTSTKKPESMHHSQGAASETHYIYGDIFSETCRQFFEVYSDQKIHAGVVGLGLGYIEILIALIAQQKGLTVAVTSFEKVESLKNIFQNWIKFKTPTLHDLVFEKIIETSSPEFRKNNIPTKDCIQSFLSHTQNLQILPELNQDLHLVQQCVRNGRLNYIAFDAFSQATDLPLWTEEFLSFFLEHYAATDCVLSTYACTGLLKRVLKERGFHFIKRKGFSGKRDATLAVRGIFSSNLTTWNLFQIS